MKKIKITLLACLAMILGCQENSEEAPINENEVIFEKNEAQDALAHQFANLLAASLQDESMRNFVKEEAVAKFDGDYDILFAAAKNKEVSGKTNARGETLTFQEALYTNASAARTSANDLDELLAQLEAQYPTMQIAVPELASGSAEDWETGSLNPLIAVMESDYDESTTDMVTAYDSEGNTYEISSSEEPEQLTIVISPSERVMAFPVDHTARAAIDDCDLAEPYAKTLNYNLYLIEEVPIDCGGTGGGDSTGGGGSSASCDTENIKSMRFDDVALNDIEHWISGAPEIKLLVYTYNGGYKTKAKHLGVFEPSKRSYINDIEKWWNVNGSIGKHMFDWDSGDKFWLWFYEKDPTGSNPDCDNNKTCAYKCGTKLFFPNGRPEDLPYPTTSVDWHCVPGRHDFIVSTEFHRNNGTAYGDCNEEKTQWHLRSGTFQILTRRIYK